MNNYKEVFKIFKKHYVLVPLEIFTDPYTALISTLMSARTRDSVTVNVAKDLFKVAPDLKSLKKLSQNKIEEIIKPISFYKTKAKHIYELAHTIDKIPDTREELMELPGVGRKTANLVINRAFNTPAIAVDTHVFKISNMLGWVHTKTPEETEIKLMEVLPKKYWSETNKLFVSIGQQYRSERLVKEFLKENRLI
ncbi:MAG TPA: endonuclease III [Patescibacteria group bacterium]|nr:endonuclease III [Patescibacteria group bacterium]